MNLERAPTQVHWLAISEVFYSVEELKVSDKIPPNNKNLSDAKRWRVGFFE